MQCVYIVTFLLFVFNFFTFLIFLTAFFWTLIYTLFYCVLNVYPTTVYILNFTHFLHYAFHLPDNAGTLENFFIISLSSVILLLCILILLQPHNDYIFYFFLVFHVSYHFLSTRRTYISMTSSMHMSFLSDCFQVFLLLIGFQKYYSVVPIYTSTHFLFIHLLSYYCGNITQQFTKTLNHCLF